MIDKIIYGDNQFFGINHSSEEKALKQAIQFQDEQDIIKTLVDAYDSGIRTFMCTTHDKLWTILDYFREHDELDMKFIPCLPYAHKYASSLTEIGVLDTLKKYSSKSALGTIFSGGKALLTRDIEGLMKNMIDAELSMFKDLPIDGIFLQNVMTDLLLGLGAKDLLLSYHTYVKEKYGVEAGFITMNLPKCYNILKSAGIKKPLICSSFNLSGFRMNPSIEAYKKVLENEDLTFIAMSVLASGALPISEAINEIKKQKGISSVLFGASSKKNISDMVKRLS